MRKLLLALALLVAPSLYAQSYTTAFPLTENPISEGHSWINGGTCGDPALCVGLDWKNVQTTPGFAFGTQVGAGTTFDDSTAVMSGTWGPNQTVTAQVFHSGPFAAEMEIRLHTTIAPHNITGYELLCVGGPVMQIVRWEGPLGAFTIIKTGTTPCAPNDIFKGTIVNNADGSVTINGFINNVLAINVTDSGANGPVFRTGNPGIGFFNDGGAPVTSNQMVNFTATASGAPITATLLPSSLTFASQNVGSTSLGQNVTLTNTSGAGTNLTVSGISITGTNANNFNQTNGCPGTLASGAACTITVNFTPSATGSRTASLSVSTNAGTQTTSLTGTGVGTVAGPPWSAILSPSRAIDWSGAGLPPTLPDGETTVNPWTPPTGRTQCGSTIAAYSGTADTINNALIACAGLGGRYVLLGPGTFTISTDIWFRVAGGNALSAVTLRGSGAGGANQTKINLTGNSAIRFGVAWNAGVCTWSTGFAVGATSLTTSSCSGPAIQTGAMIGLSQCDTGYTGPIAANNTSTGCLTGTSADNGGIYVCGNNTHCQQPGQPAGGPQQAQYQWVFVTGTSGATVNFTPGIRMPNYGTANAANLQWVTTSAGTSPEAYGNGLEDFTVHSSGSTSAQGIIEFSGNYASWIKGVRIVGITNTTTIRISQAKNLLFTNNYIDTNFEGGAGPPQTPILEGNDSDVLHLNNMIVGGIPFDGTGSSTGDVFAYIYNRDSQTEYVENSSFQHSAGASFSLYEGNQYGKSNEDDTHGTHNLNTWFRNYHRGWDSPYALYGGTTCAAASCQTMTIDDYARFDNAIGNVFGGPYIFTYEGTGSANNTVYLFDHTLLGDTLAKASFMRWGNCDTSTTPPVCKFNSSEVPITLSGNAAPLNNNAGGGPGVPGTQNLPCTFFLKGYNTSTTCSPHPSGNTGLSWWKVCQTWTTFPTSCASFQTPPFPTVGPDVTGGPNVFGHAYDNPAAIAWSKLPIDPAYQIAYAIQSSSWSAGTETLTFAAGVLPGTHRLMGGFQITGAPLCNTAAGAEFQMTASTSTTVKYALAADPGANACSNGGAGRMRFPDVRQFDERVYSLDSGGLPTAAMPTAAPPAGTFTTTQNVALSTTSGPVICYSTTTTPVTNGTTGCTTGTLYSTPISIAVTTTLRAVAGGTGFVDSNVFTGVYTIAAVTPVATPPAGTYTGVQNVVLTTTTSGATICFTQDGSTPTASNGTCTHGTTYASAIPVSATQTINALATKSGLANSGILTATYNFNPVAATPTASPVAGTYATTQNVTLSTTSPGAIICYSITSTPPATNGGTGCSSGTKFTVPIVVAATTTILAKAGGAGFTDSSTLTALYTINPVAIAPSITPGTGTYTSSQTVAMATGSSGAHICYTTNGSTPATTGGGCSSGTLYSTPITVSVATTVKAIAGGTGFTDSAVTTAVFSFRATQPTAAPGSGTYTATQSVVLSSVTGSVICYTTNGTAPVTDTTTGCTNGTHYTVPISISTSQILKAVAGGTGFVDSTVATFTYTINAIASTPTFIPVAGTYSGSQSVTITSASPGAIKCYTVDGSTPATNGTTGCTAGTLYSGPVTVATNLTLKAIAGGSNFTDSAVGSAAYVITTPVATPTFSPVSGTYTGSQNITISTTTGSATLCYTIDGSTPTGDGAGTCTHGTTYTVPVVVATTLTLKAVGTKSGNSDSAVASAGYVITLVASTPTASPVQGTYTGAQSVSLSSASAGAIICYSTTTTLPHTNGVAACSSGTLYSGAINVGTTTTILAVAGGSGFTDSSIATFVYTINTVAIAPALTPGTGTYVSTQSVSMSTPSVSAVICYTTNGTTPQTNGGAGCTTGSLYSVSVSVSVAETIKAIAGGTGYTDSLVTSAVYTFRATAPTATPGAGTYTGTQSVVLTTPVGGVICYTIDGTTPVTDGSTNCTTGTKYTVAISVATTETLLAVAGGTGFVDSTVSSFLYRINTLAATPVFSLPAGTYSGSQSLTITAVPSSVICVTTSGATPATDGASGCSSGTVYSGTITVSTSETVKAIAGGTGFTDGSVTSAAYVITTPVATPTFNPLSGTYSGTQSVVISTATSSATLCYTIDNTTPTANGAGVCTHGSTYVGPVSVAVNTTLKAIGSKAGNSDSAVATANYVITTVANAPTASPVAGTYATAQSVSLSTISSGAVICYSTTTNPQTNGVSGCTTGTLYVSPITVSVTTTIRAVAGGTGFTDSSISSFLYTINPVAVAPSITPGTGTYSSSQSVTLSTASVGAIICYTTNGATPVPSGASCSVGTLFTVPITVSTAQTLKAVAGGTGFTNSLVSTAVYSFSASAVVASPGAGSYTGTQNITLTKTTGTVICYSTTVTPVTNGAAGCSVGTLYSTPVAIASSQTLRAVAGGTGFVDGPLGTFVYVINNAPPPAPAIVIFSLLRRDQGTNTNVSASWTDTPNLVNTFWWYNAGLTLNTGTQVNSTGSYTTSWAGKVHPNSAITFEVCDNLGCLTRLI